MPEPSATTSDVDLDHVDGDTAAGEHRGDDAAGTTGADDENLPHC